MPADWMIKQGNTQPAFADRLTLSDGTVPPLVGATLTFRLRSLTDASLVTTTGTATITNPLTGDVLFVPTAADTAIPGNYFVEWHVVYAVSTGLGNQTFPTDGYEWLVIEPNLALQGQQIVSVVALKRYLNIQGTDRTRDSELIEMIDAIAPLVEAEVGPIVPKVYEEWRDGGSKIIKLDHDPSAGFGSNPYLKLVAVSEYRGGSEYPLALVASPSLGSIYSVMLVPDLAAITRRSAAGSSIPFSRGTDSVHIFYQAGQSPIPAVIQRAALEYLRTLYRWPQQTGQGSLSPADRMELGAAFQGELSRITRTWLRPMKRYPSIA